MNLAPTSSPQLLSRHFRRSFLTAIASRPRPLLASPFTTTLASQPISKKLIQQASPPRSTPGKNFTVSSRAFAHDPVYCARMEASYTFPASKIRSVLKNEEKTPLVLVSCGSFSPITFLHLRMFEMCKDWVKENTQFEIVAGYLSPVSDAYKKAGLASAHHRSEMCRLAVQESNWIMLDGWEAIKPEYTRTALVLDHFQHEINEVRGGIQTPSGKRKKARIALMSGADLIQTMSVPGVWAEEDLDHILGRYGAFIIERSGTDLAKALASLEQWRSQIYTIPQLIQNDVSSTKIRLFLSKDMSIRYLIPEPALTYLDKHGLFREDSPSRAQSRGVNNGEKDAATRKAASSGDATNGE